MAASLTPLGKEAATLAAETTAQREQYEEEFSAALDAVMATGPALDELGKQVDMLLDATLSLAEAHGVSTD